MPGDETRRLLVEEVEDEIYDIDASDVGQQIAAEVVASGPGGAVRRTTKPAGPVPEESSDNAFAAPAAAAEPGAAGRGSRLGAVARRWVFGAAFALLVVGASGLAGYALFLVSNALGPEPTTPTPSKSLLPKPGERINVSRDEAVTESEFASEEAGMAFVTTVAECGIDGKDWRCELTSDSEPRCKAVVAVPRSYEHQVVQTGLQRGIGPPLRVVRSAPDNCSDF